MEGKVANPDKPNVLLNIVCFVVVLIGTPATFLMLAVPALLIGLPVAIFAKSVRTKWIGVSIFMGAVIWFPIYLVSQLFK